MFFHIFARVLGARLVSWAEVRREGTTFKLKAAMLPGMILLALDTCGSLWHYPSSNVVVYRSLCLPESHAAPLKPIACAIRKVVGEEVMLVVIVKAG